MANRQYLNSIRAASCYPAFRSFIAFFEGAGYLAAAIIGIFGLFVGDGPVLLVGVVVAVIVALLVKVSAEACLMLADIADATIDSFSRDRATPDTALAAAPLHGSFRDNATMHVEAREAPGMEMQEEHRERLLALCDQLKERSLRREEYEELAESIGASVKWEGTLFGRYVITKDGQRTTFNNIGQFRAWFLEHVVPLIEHEPSPR